MLLLISLRNLQRFPHRSADTITEPGLQAEIEQQNGQHGDEQARQYGDKSKEADQSRVQASSGRIPPALRPEAYKPSCYQGAEAYQQDEIKNQQGKDAAGAGSPGKPAGGGQPR